MTSPDTLLLLSGGIDSAYCMWWALSQGRALHVHHVHLKNHEGRLQYEARAVEGILNWMREQGLTSFRYTESSFDYGSIRWIVKDHCVWAFFIGIILAGPQNKGIKRVIRPDHFDSLPTGPDGPGMQRAHRRYREISWQIHERDDIIWEHPIQHLTKAQVIRSMPPGLLELCWWCRRPTVSGEPCHRCYTCRLVDRALERGRDPLLEAKVLRRFKCKYSKEWYEAGDVYRHPDSQRMEYLASREPPIVEWPPGDEAPTGPKHIGGGWYELPDGRRIKGKNAALAALQEG